MEDGSPALEVGFAIDTSNAFDDLAQLQRAMNSTEAKVVAEAAKIERATSSMVNLGSATAQFSAFSTAATREMRAAAREAQGVERAIERMISALDRDTVAVGRTRDQQRAARAEELATAAARLGNTDAANRLTASLRSLQAAQSKLTEDRLAAEVKAQADAMRERESAEAAVIAQLRERAQLESALARTTGADRPRATDAGATYSALAAKAAEDEARAHNLAAAAVKREADEHARLAALVRGSHDAEMADAIAAERMREATDPLYAAVKRLNAEVAESTRLYHSGATAPAEYARQQEVLAQRLRLTTEQHEAMAIAGGKNANAMRNLVIQMPDVVQGLLTGQKPFTILIQQGGQLAQVALMTEGGLMAMAAAAGTLALYLAPLAVVAGVGYVAFAKFQSAVKDSGELTRYRDSLGLTHKEMLQLSDGVEKAGGKIEQLAGVTVTAGDLMSGLWKTISDQAGSGGNWDGLKKGASEAFDWIIAAWNKTSAGITAGIYGTVNASKVIWSSFATSVGDIFYQSVNLAIGAMNTLVKAGTDILNGFVHAANKVPGVNIGDFKATQVAEVQNPFAGASSKEAAAAAWKAVGDGYKSAYAQARKEDAAFWAQVGTNAKKSAMDRMKAEADAIKANRTAPKPKVDRNALNADATEAQIKNLYRLADAYGVSGAAALIAEARVKAESEAITRRADVDAAVERQIRLSIAQRVSDAAKGTASIRDQADAQERVNASVAAGLVPAQQAADLVKSQIADLPLLAAIEAAQQQGLAKEAARATKALADQRAERERLMGAESRARLASSTETGKDRLAELREELRLIGATDEARARGLAEFRAQQEVSGMKGIDPAQAAEYVKLQGDIAAQTERNRAAQDDYNASLTFAADKWDLIARNVQRAGQGMADAFGSAGKAIGDLATIYAGFHADRERLDAQHKAEITRAGIDQNKIAIENAKYALRTSTLQVGAYGDMAAAAKGFFGENTAGYQALAAAEKAFRAVEFALSVRAMAQDAAETVGSIARSGARAAAHGVEAVAKAIASLPFPLNLAAGAATAAAIASLGISIAGSFGGGGARPAPSNTGTGTVLGDTSAKSESIKRAIDELKAVDTLTNVYSRQMLDSLRSIDSQISGVASVIVRGGDINASANVTTGFKTNTIGKVASSIIDPTGLFSKIPVLGDIIGGIKGVISSLFGTRTDVTGSGIYGGAQSLGSILGGGFNGQAYSDITKTKKFLGIVSGRSYSTQYGALDPNLSNQFTLILRSFNDAIAAAAGPLGQSTEEIQKRLNGFVVNIGKIDLKGLTGEQIQEKLTAIFGAAADGMANAALPGLQQFQKVGEGAFETLVRVASTAEQVTTSLDLLGASTRNLSLNAKLGLADQFDSVSAMKDAADGYFQAFYSQEEQTAAKAAQMAKVFASLGFAVPGTLASFRQLVEAQDLTTAAGQAAYATLLKLAPAFADLQQSMAGAKSAADILSERQDLERQLLELQGRTDELRRLDLAKLDASNRALQQQVWALQDSAAATQAATQAAEEAAQAQKAIAQERAGLEQQLLQLQGDTAALRARQLEGLDASNRALQQQIYAVQDAQEAAKAADDLRQAWTSIGDTIEDEVKRIRGLTDTTTGGGFASLLGQFNAATNAARGGSQDAAKSLPQLSQAVLAAAADAATSQQELARVQAQIARSLEDTLSIVGGTPGASSSDVLARAAAQVAAAAPATADNSGMMEELRLLRQEVADMRQDNNRGHAATAGNTGAINRRLENVTNQSGGDAISIIASEPLPTVAA